MPGFIQLTIIYAFVYSTILTFLLHRCRKLRKKNKITYSLKFYFIDFVLGIIIFYLPISFYSFMQINSYPNPDTYGYVISSHLDSWNIMPIDPYYKAFPIYVLLNKFIGIVTNLDYSLSIIILQESSLLLILLSPILLIRIIDRESAFKIPLLTSYALILISSIYLYAYFNIFIPQIFVLWIIIFLLYSLYRGMILLFILFSILALVHFLIIPLFQIYFILVLLIEHMLSRIKFIRPTINRNLKNMLMALLILLPIHFSYTFYAYKEQSSLLQYIKYYLQLINDILYRPERLGVVITMTSTGISRQYPFLSALATGSFLGLVIIGAVNLIIDLFRRREHNSTIVASMILGAMLTVIGIARYYIVTHIPSLSVARYVNVPGLFLLSVFAIYTLYTILSKYPCKMIYYFLLVMLCSGMVGSFFNPLTLPLKPSTKDVILIQTVSNLFEPHLYSSIRFLSERSWYYLGPQLAFWTFRTQHLLPHFRYIIDTSLNEEYLHIYANIVFSMGMHNVYLMMGKEELIFP